MTTPEERQLIDVLSLWTLEQRASLLELLELPDEERVARIEEIHQRHGGPVAELLLDIEENRPTLVTVRAILRVMN